MIKGFDHYAITVADMEATIAFYRTVLGAEILWEKQWREGKIPVISMQLGANRMNVHPASAPAAPHARQPTPGSADLCFRWEGPITTAAAMLEKNGVAIIEGPAPRPAADGIWGQSVYFRDPDGNLLELLSTFETPEKKLL
ncbi:MAG: VOC family protein [Alphaproteobacteria bacterium]|nr:VOC family protein [Alphaproteobacteria bacterium]